MRFIVDEQLPPALARWIERQGCDAEHVFDAGMLGLSDLDIAHRAHRSGAVVVTKDEDFASDRIRARALQVLWLRLGNVSNRILLSRMEVAWADVIDRLGQGETLVVVSPPIV